MRIRRFLHRCFHSPEKLGFSIKSQKSFFTIYFHDLLHENTGGYRGLQGDTGEVTRGYRGLQGVTGGYKGLQGVTGGSQGVTMGYRGLQGITGDYRGVTGGYKRLEGVAKKYLEFIFSIKAFPFNSKASIRAHKHIF